MSMEYLPIPLCHPQFPTQCTQLSGCVISLPLFVSEYFLCLLNFFFLKTIQCENIEMLLNFVNWFYLIYTIKLIIIICCDFNNIIRKLRQLVIYYYLRCLLSILRIFIWLGPPIPILHLVKCDKRRQCWQYLIIYTNFRGSYTDHALMKCMHFF